jgi:hypothetical protein
LPIFIIQEPAVQHAAGFFSSITAVIAQSLRRYVQRKEENGTKKKAGPLIEPAKLVEQLYNL